MFLYNNKKNKGYKSGCIYKTRRYCFTCKQVPDQTGRQDREKGTGRGWWVESAPRAKRRVRWGEGLLPAYIYRQELESRTHGRGRRHVRCWLCAGERDAESQECSSARPLAPCSSGFSLEWGSGWGPGASWASWPEREGGDCSPVATVENWRRLLGMPILLASGQPGPFCHPPRPAEMPTGTQGEQVQQPGLLAFLGRDRRCRSTPVLRSSMGGQEPVTEGRRGWAGRTGQ